MQSPRPRLERYTAPGLYYESQDFACPARATRTDVAGFVGVAQRGPFNVAVMIESWDQFRSEFGEPFDQGYLAYAVRAFFDNQGRRCWVVRAGEPRVGWHAQVDLAVPGPRVLMLRVTAHEPGSVGTHIFVRLAPRPGGRFSLEARRGEKDYAGRSEREVWQNIDPEAVLASDQSEGGFVLGKKGSRSGAPSKLIYAQLMPGRPWFDEHPSKRTSPLSRIDVSNILPEVALKPPYWEKPLQKPDRELNSNTKILLKHLIGDPNQTDRTGLRVLELKPDVSLVAIPDLVWDEEEVEPSKPRFPDLDCRKTPEPLVEPKQLGPQHRRVALSPSEVFEGQRAIIRHCEAMADRFALLDSARSSEPEQLVADYGFRRDSGLEMRSSFAAVYAPWLAVEDPRPTRTGALRLTPPSGSIAGLIARLDHLYGVHKPPGNERVYSAQAVSQVWTDPVRGLLNDDGINVIVPIPNRGVRVYGARTLAPAEEHHLVRYVHVRRLLLLIETDVQKLGQEIVFAGNTARQQGDLARVVRVYLEKMWQRGQLDGATADEAFSVTCDETTNPPDEMERGRLICQIGVMPPAPAEFVIVRVGVSRGEFEEGRFA